MSRTPIACTHVMSPRTLSVTGPASPLLTDGTGATTRQLARVLREVARQRFGSDPAVAGR